MHAFPRVAFDLAKRHQGIKKDPSQRWEARINIGWIQ